MNQGARKVRDYVSHRMNAEMPPDFVGGVMGEVRQTPQRHRWGGWSLVATLATVGAAVAVVGIGLGLVDGRNGVGTSPQTPSQAPQTERPSFTPLPSGAFGPVWSMAPAEAFAAPASCENPAGMPSIELGENVGWRISMPGDWYTAESYLGECFWFGPQPWQTDLENAIPPDEVAVVISLLDGRVTPDSPEFQGGSVAREEPFTVAGAPAVRYEISGSDGDLLAGDGVIWVIGVHGELPTFEAGGATPTYMVVYTSSTGAGRLAQQVEVLDRMVATLEITDR